VLLLLSAGDIGEEMEGMSAVGDGDGELTRETILQRHNYEMEEHRRKFPTASLGKKKRAEAARIEDEMRRRHGRELEELEERMAELMGNNETSGGDCEATAKDSDQDKSAVPEDATDGNGLTKEETGGVPAPKKKSKAQKRREQRAKEEVPSPTNHLHRCRIIAVNRPVGFFRERALWIEFDFQKIQPLHQSIAIHCFICLECQDIVDGDVLIFLKFYQRSSSAKQTNGQAHHRASTSPVGDTDEVQIKLDQFNPPIHPPAIVHGLAGRARRKNCSGESERGSEHEGGGAKEIACDVASEGFSNIRNTCRWPLYVPGDCEPTGRHQRGGAD